MILVTQFDGSQLWLNPQQIVSLAAHPDTVIQLNSGDKLLVKESCEQLRDRFIEYQQRIHERAFSMLKPESSAI